MPTSIRGAPTNYLGVFSKGTNEQVPKEVAEIWGRYFIDLSIPPLPQTVPHVVSGPENLYLHTPRGSVAVEVWLTGNNNLRRASMKIYCDNGNVHAQVVCLRSVVSNFSSK